MGMVFQMEMMTSQIMLINHVIEMGMDMEMTLAKKMETTVQMLLEAPISTN